MSVCECVCVCVVTQQHAIFAAKSISFIGAQSSSGDLQSLSSRPHSLPIDFCHRFLSSLSATSSSIAPLEFILCDSARTNCTHNCEDVLIRFMCALCNVATGTVHSSKSIGNVSQMQTAFTICSNHQFTNRIKWSFSVCMCISVYIESPDAEYCIQITDTVQNL